MPHICVYTCTQTDVGGVAGAPMVSDLHLEFGGWVSTNLQTTDTRQFWMTYAGKFRPVVEAFLNLVHQQEHPTLPYCRKAMTHHVYYATAVALRSLGVSVHIVLQRGLWSLIITSERCVARGLRS